jgi:Fic family protein
MSAESLMEPILPMEVEQLPLMEAAADLRTEVARLLPGIGAASREALASLLRAMNSYYSNKIEGQHTFPADLEQALQQQFSPDQDVRRRQELAIAHMQVEAMLEPEARAMEWDGHFSAAWVQRIHRELYQRLDEESRVVVDREGKRRGIMTPGDFRTGHVKVQHHEAPPPEKVGELMAHFEARYRAAAGESAKLLLAGSSLHRLSWIHPFPDGNGRVSRLQNHLLLAHLSLTGGLWSPLRGLARRQQDYYNALSAADLPRRNDFDGRGNLSSKGLADFIAFWLEVCLDQVRFMNSMLALEGLQQRYVALALQVLYDYGRGPLLHHRSKADPEKLGRALYRLFVEGRLERGEFGAMLDTSDRTVSRVIGNLLAQRLARSASRLGALEPGLPFFSLKYLFPGLWPEAEGVMTPPHAA